MFEVSIENSFDFRSEEYVELFERSAATPFQGPVWLDGLYRKLLPHNAAKPLILVVRHAADKSLAMVLPLVRRRYSGLRVVEFADLRVSDYVSPVTDAATFADILADRRCVARLRSLVHPYDLLRIGKLADSALAIGQLFDIPRREAMGTNAYETPLGETYEVWRGERLPRSYRKELDKKSRQLHRRGAVRLECCEGAERVRKTLEALRFYRGLRFGSCEDGTGDLMQVPAYYGFYLDVATGGLGRYARTYNITVDGRIVAGALGLASRRGSFLVILSGFDHDGYKNQSLGSLLFEQIARDCIERGERFLDFTIGDEPYKLTFGAVPSPMWRVSRAGSALGYAAHLLVERMPAARSLARRLFHGSRDGRTITARPVATTGSASKEPATT